MGFPGGTVVKNLPVNTGGKRDVLSVPGSGISSNGNPLQYSCHGQRSLAGYSLRGCKESDTTVTEHTHRHTISKTDEMFLSYTQIASTLHRVR